MKKVQDEISLFDETISGNIAIGAGETDSSKYEYLELHSVDRFGVIMRQEDLLASKEIITPEDLLGNPLIVSRHSLRDNNLINLLGCDTDKLNIVATYNLLFNGSIMVDEGIGYALALDRIINTSCTSSLCYRPLSRQIQN